MIAWRYDFDDERFHVVSDQFPPTELAALTLFGGIIVHRADDGALALIMKGSVLPWVDCRQLLDCKGRRFERKNFLLPIETVSLL